MDDKVPTVSNQVDSYADTYGALWQAKGHRTNLSFRGPPSGRGAQLGRSSVDVVRRISKTHREWTAVGNDDVHPRHLQHWTDDAIEAIIDLMMLCGKFGYALAFGPSYSASSSPKPTGAPVRSA